jgi:hypothetical protein
LLERVSLLERRSWRAGEDEQHYAHPEKEVRTVKVKTKVKAGTHMGVR